MVGREFECEGHALCGVGKCPAAATILAFCHAGRKFELLEASAAVDLLAPRVS
jgi:hypothetical protein